MATKEKANGNGEVKRTRKAKTPAQRIGEAAALLQAVLDSTASYNADEKNAAALQAWRDKQVPQVRDSIAALAKATGAIPFETFTRSSRAVKFDIAKGMKFKYKGSSEMVEIVAVDKKGRGEAYTAKFKNGLTIPVLRANLEPISA